MPAFAASDDERAFRGIALDEPAPGVIAERCVAAQEPASSMSRTAPSSGRSGGSKRPSERIPPPPTSIERPPTKTRRAVISPLVSVPVLSEQITVVHPERLDGRHPPHERVALRHLVHSDRERAGDDGRQRFRHGGDRERDGEHRHRQHQLEVELVAHPRPHDADHDRRRRRRRAR